jgi:hypothetical protein
MSNLGGFLRFWGLDNFLGRSSDKAKDRTKYRDPSLRSG